MEKKIVIGPIKIYGCTNDEKKRKEKNSQIFVANKLFKALLFHENILPATYQLRKRNFALNYEKNFIKSNWLMVIKIL